VRMAKASRVLALAAVAALAVPGVSLAASHGTTKPSSPRHAATTRQHKVTPRQHKLTPGQLKLYRAIMGKGAVKASQSKALHARLKPRVALGNFSQCPKLPAGSDPTMAACGLIHITGGVLDIGAAHQILNREITISFGQVTDASGNTTFVPGTTKSAPMPVLGGIFETPEVDKATSKDKNLQLHVQPVGAPLSFDISAPDPVVVAQRVKVVNPVFGKNCTIGTKKNPIVLDPTFGTTNPPPPAQPETGHIDDLEQIGNELVLIGTVVDNAFAAPAATGCGPPGATDPNGALNRVVNLVAALPSAAGNNNAAFQVTIELTSYSSI
jgi:hypothetical protein